jgi:hypothetical protein
MYIAFHYSRQSHNTNYKDWDTQWRVIKKCLLSCDTMQICRFTPISRRHLLPPSSWLQWGGFHVARLYKVTKINKDTQVGKVFVCNTPYMRYSLFSSWSMSDFSPLPGVCKPTNFMSTLVGPHPALLTLTMTIETASSSETLISHIKLRRWSEKKYVFVREKQKLIRLET